ncbi:MAG: hypothetical protein DRJ32_01100 [Thermoprotei archaeon]|nr:MAG: hypothetical protein DRJ32_01100 [Thermoprotei archaeon]
MLRRRVKRFNDYLLEMRNLIGIDQYDRIAKLSRMVFTSLNAEKLILLMEELEKALRGIRLPQYYGKVRATLFEEYVYRLLERRLPPEFTVIRNYPVGISDQYFINLDIAVLKNKALCSAIECKVELDAARLKNSIGNFVLLKAVYSHVLTFIVYIRPEISSDLLKITLLKGLVDGIYSIMEIGELALFLSRL